MVDVGPVLVDHRERGSTIPEALVAAGLYVRAGMDLIVKGRSNQEIADGCFLSVNSVKTYIRSAHRKIGVSHRAQAVVWAMQNGFAPPLRDEG